MTTDSFAGISDEAFEKYLDEGGNGESAQEPLNEAPVVSDTSLDESPENDAESSPESVEDESGEDLDTETNDEQESQEAEEPSEEASEEQTTEEGTEETLDDLFKPFKASGRDFSVNSIDEAKKLMAMGVDYSQKLAGFKQHRKTIKTLEANEVSHDDLNFLLDLKKGNPEAIAKLIKDHNIDTMDLDEKDSGYTPTNHSVSDSQVELDDVISRIQDSASFSRTSDIVSNQWDDASKKIIFDNPQLLETLNTQVSDGTYERIMTEVQRAKVFGGLQGLTDIQAYETVGRQLTQQAPQQEVKPVKTVSTKPKAKPSNAEQKLRASSPRKAPKQAKEPVKAFAGMSDAEFEKLLSGS